METELHQSQLAPEANKFHVGNGEDGKHYWLTPPDLYSSLDARYTFTFDPCPFPLPAGFDGLTCEWGASNYVNPPFGSIVHEGKKKGPTAWVRKAIAEQQKGKRVVLVYPVDKWLLMLLKAGATVENLGDVRWLATEDRTQGKGTGRHIAMFTLEPSPAASGNVEEHSVASLKAEGPVAAPEALTDELERLRVVCSWLTGQNYHDAHALIDRIERALASQPVAVEREES
jgi:hypothetical protein